MKLNTGHKKKAHQIKPHILSFLLVATMAVLTLATSFDPKEDPSFLIPDDKLDETMLAAVRGDGEAAYLLALHFGNGKLDIVNEIFWYTTGAENGHPDAQYTLSLNYSLWIKERGRELRKVFWLQKVATIDYEDSMFRLERWGYTLETAQPPDDGLFPPSPTLSEEEVARYEEGAWLGSGQAALVLAAFSKNNSLEADAAEYWYRIGAQNGNVECMRRYGEILLGKDGSLDKERGRFWLGQAYEG